MSIKFNISNDIAQAAIDKLNNNKIQQDIIQYVAECFNIILTLYQNDIISVNKFKVIKKRGRRKQTNVEITEESNISNSKE